MPRYAYSAYAKSGEIENGEVFAENDVAALDVLTSRGLKPVSLIAGGSAEKWWQRDFSLTGGAAQARPEALEQFFRTLAGLLEVRFPLPRAMRFCAGQSRDRRLARALGRVTDALEGGQTLAEALKNEDGYFPDRFVAMIDVGEAANRLPEIVSRAADTLTTEAERRRELRSALIYPAILMAMSLLVLAMMIFYLAPTLMPVFGSAGSEPPAIMLAMINIRSVLLSGWPMILAGLAAAAFVSRLLVPPVRRMLFRVGLRLPVTGAYLRQVNTLGLCQTLVLMLAGGAPLPRAVSTARDAAPLGPYRDLIARTLELINAGGTLAESLGTSKLIDPMAVAMIEAGEEADQLPQVLDRLVRDLRSRSARTLTQAIRAITPILTLLIGVGVGAVILSTVTAIMNLNDIAF